MQYVDHHSDYLATLVGRYGPTASGLEELVRRCHGAYPTEVRGVVDAMHQVDPTSVALAARRQRSPDVRHLEAADSRLPLPHPLDFEWRFARVGSGSMIEQLLRATVDSDELALLGTPGLAEQFAQRRSGPRRVTLFERRPEACNAMAERSQVELVEGDVGETWRQYVGQFTTAVADPPWYPLLSELFVRVAGQLLKPGGQLYWCAPGLGTRPGLPEERARLIATAAAAGLVLEELHASTVLYECPPFELFALQAAGLPAFDHNWRRGDLLRFRRTRLPTDQHPAPSAALTSGTDDWREVSVGRARVRVNLGAVGTAVGLPLESLTDGDILDSVSTRDERRREANVWTGTNRIWRTNSPRQLMDSLRMVKNLAGSRKHEPFDEIAEYILRGELDMLNSIGIG